MENEIKYAKTENKENIAKINIASKLDKSYNLDKLPKSNYCNVTFYSPPGSNDSKRGNVNTIKMTWELASIYAAKKQKGSKKVISVVPIEDIK